MTAPTPEPEQLLDAYLDGRLLEADRTAFERKLGSDAQLRGQVELQRGIDAALGRLFTPARAQASTLPLAPSHSTARIIGLAAALMIACITGWLYLSRPVAGPNPLVVAYQDQIDNGFRPQVVCTGQAEFAEWMRRYFGQPLYPADSGSVQLVGWAYAPVVSSRSGILLAKSQEKPIVLVVDYAVREKRPLLASGSDSGLRTFRQKLGSVVVYEISPLDRATVLPLLSTTAPPGFKPLSPGS